jgi:CCR4-NOT complex subunit CAF16
LLDEVTVDLDVVVRRNLLDFLRNECPGSTIIYATHIFDGIGEWPTHIAHMNAGTIVKCMSIDDVQQLEAFKSAPKANSPLLFLVEQWLRKDFSDAKVRKRALEKAHTHWHHLSENQKAFGDKYYNYYNHD